MGLITRQIGPNAKGSKLTFTEMDNNLYYLQNIGVSNISYSSNTITITTPTGSTKSITILSLTGVTIGTLSVTGNTTLSGLTVTGNTTLSGQTTFGNLVLPLVSPNNPIVGSIYLNESDNKLMIYDGSSWGHIVIN